MPMFAVGQRDRKNVELVSSERCYYVNCYAWILTSTGWPCQAFEYEPDTN